MALHRRFLSVYLLAVFLIGLGYLAILPVFEGFDENAHYSSLRQIAETGAIPLYGSSYLNREILDYQGPTPYGSLEPPYDKGMVYAKFFARPELAEHYRQTYRRPYTHPPYAASQELNWQAQHPPLYYLLFAPLMKATDGLSFVAQIFILRLASFVLALGGIAFGLAAFRPWRPSPSADTAAAGFILYPLILPMFFPEFTRIGNDSLCIFLVGVVAYCLSFWLEDERNTKAAITVGVALGMGLLTKAFFLPITAALALFLLFRIGMEKTAEATRPQRYRSLTKLFLPALLIGGAWYFYNLSVHGDLSGGNDAIRLARQGGLLANLQEHFSLFSFIRGVIVPLVSYAWAGTWSLARLPDRLYLPLLLLAAWVAAAFLSQAKRRPLADPIWLPVWVFAAFMCGLLWHVVISVALNGNGNTPGWYLHILAPWIAPILGVGVAAIWRSRRGAQPLLIGLLLYAALFQAMALWAQFALFTGCAGKGADKHYVFSGPAFCLDQIPLLVDRLAVLGWPTLAALGFGGGIICVFWLLRQSWRLRQA